MNRTIPSPFLRHDSLAGFAVLLAWLPCWLISGASAADRWEARLADGQILTATEIANWNEPAATPSFAGRSLLETGNPFVSLLDRQARWLPAEAAIEFFGGDRLSGEILSFHPDSETAYEAVAAHFLIKPLAELSQPDHSQNTLVRASTRWVRRIIRERVTDHYQPGTVWLPGGGQVAFRSLRWRADGITLLTTAGLRTFSFADVAEIHCLAQDDWQCYAEQLATLTPDLQSRLVQVETIDGSRLTTSLERFQARHWGDRKRNESWLQLIQPAWAIDALWVRFPAIAAWRWFAADEPPLSLGLPTAVHRETLFGASWNWKADRNVLGELLIAGDQPFTRGFGVHGSTALTFNLPPYATGFRSACGLDRAAGSGGSVRMFVRGPQDQKLFETPPLIGATQRIDTGWLSFDSPENQSATIQLGCDMLRDNAPAGSDPFDIRDIADWAEPVVRFDRARLLAAVRGHTASSVPGITGWKLTSPAVEPLQTRNWLDETDHRSVKYRTLWTTSRPWLLLQRTLKVTARDRWLSVIVSRFDSISRPTAFQLRVDGVSAGEFEIPLRQGPIDPQPVSVPLPPGNDRQVQVELILYSPSGAQPASWWDLRGIVSSAELPGIKVLFDEGQPAWLTPLPAGTAIDTEQAFSGSSSLRLDGSQVLVPEAAELTTPISDLPRLGEFRLFTFAWKGRQTPGMQVALAHDGRLGAAIAEGLGLEVGPNGAVRNRSRLQRLEERGLKYGFRYDMGKEPAQASPAPLRIARAVSEEWKFEVRDLISDFGTLRLTGFGLECQAPGQGWFDAIALVRTPQDAEVLRQRYGLVAQKTSDSTYARIVTRREDLGPAIATFAPEFAAADASQGLFQKREHQGQTGGWQTHPLAQDQPFILRTLHQFPADQQQELDLLVSHQPGSDFVLQVKVNGEQILERTVNDDLTHAQRGWASLQVDLSKWQGQTALVEVCNAANGWSNEHAIWKRVQIRDVPGK